tara:strand:- start:141 stop:398 length:258 start_codon:yes stop_codon:yes gene_type:complete
MEMETLKRAVSISKQIEQKEQELETFKEMMNFGGALPSKIQISNADAPYMPQVIESPVVAMVVLDTIISQFNKQITELRTELDAL